MPNTKAAIKDLIIGFGVFEGLWTYAKINPEQEILKSLAPILQGTQFDGTYTLMWITFIILIPLLQIYATYELGGMWGLFALLFAFIGGVFIWHILGILLIFISIGLGYYSFSSSNKVSLSDFIEMIFQIIDYIKR